MNKKLFLMACLIGGVITSLYASDVKIKLNSSDGSTFLAVENVAGSSVCAISSLGHIRPGPSSNPERYIYDDSTNFATRFSSHIYVDGAYGGRYAPVSVFTLGLSTAGTDVAWNPHGSIQPSWRNNTTADDWQWFNYQVLINGLDYNPTGKVEIKVAVLARSDYEQSLRYTVRNQDTGAYGVWNAAQGAAGASPTATGTWFEGPWSDFIITAPNQLRLSCYTTDSTKWYCIYKAIIYVRPKI